MMTTTAATHLPSASWARLRDGSWGLRIEGAGLRAGDRVRARRKDGSDSIETIDRIVWTGEGVTVASVVASAKPATRSYGSSSSGRTGWADGVYLVDGDYHCTRPGCWCGGYDEAS